MDMAIGHLLKHFYFRQKSGFDYLTTYSIEKTRADLLIFGSSRAVNIYNTEIFIRKTGLSCFNVGRHGQSLFYHYAVLKSVLKRYKPQIIVLSFDAGNFSKNQSAYDRLAVLLPYYKNHPEIRSLIELKGPYERLKMLSNIYPYNSLLGPIIMGNSAYSKRAYKNINGFFPLKKTLTGPLQTFDYSKERELDVAKINAYKSFMQECINAGVPLCIVCPPYMIHSIGIDRSIIEAQKIAKENNIDFIDFSKDSFFTSKRELFADYRHLNEKGAELFSDVLIEKVHLFKSKLREM